MENHGKVELLAPAGNATGFYGAVHAGADAVYLAGNQFGARAYAENFTAEELVECIRYGHLLGRKIYLTVNTLLKNQEMGRLYEYLAPFYEAGLDAAIVQDLGVLRFLRRHFPGLKLHVSTQMTICSPWGAWLLREMGASRIVPARELNLREIVALRQHSGLEVETFIHGAMCYCYSGQCLFSSILGGRSGNRGRCAQPCRLPYSVRTDGSWSGECYPLSLKDMCTIEHIPQLIEAGIDSFKIEGRMKKPEYAAGVTDIYRRCIDYYYRLRSTKSPQEASEAYHVSRKDLNTLASLYVRGDLQDGYYFRRNGRDMVTIDSPAYRESDEELLARIREEHINTPLKLPVTVRASFHVGKPAKVTLEWGKISAGAEAGPVERAQRQPVTEENIRKQLCKLGDSAFYAAEAEISMDPDCFYPLKQMNELRRMAVARLEQKILLERGYQTGRTGTMTEGPAAMSAGRFVEAGADSSDRPCYAFYVRTLPQLKALGDWIAENRPDMSRRIYIDGDLLTEEWPQALELCRRLPGSGTLFAVLPYILRQADGGYLDSLYKKARESGIFQGFLARSMDGLGFLREMERAPFPEAHSAEPVMSCRADAGIYVWNDSALEEVSALVAGFCLPYELNGSGQRQLCENLSGLTKQLSCEKIVYGRIPMMVTANCLRKTVGECGKGQQIVTLKDRYRKEFPVLTNCLHCMNILYNSVPFSLHQELGKWEGRADLRMDFSLESAEEVSRLLDCFLKAGPFPMAEYTTGHEKRGAE